MRLLIDENVPNATAKEFEARGHETTYVRDTNARAKDPAVARIAEDRGALVVTWDVKDFRRIIREKLGMTRRESNQLGLIGFRCAKPLGALRVKEAGDLIEVAFLISKQYDSQSLIVTVTMDQVRWEMGFRQ